MASKPPLVVLVGPTAVGKTEIAIEVAEHLGGEIISADSRLFYRGMDIGTAKPTPAQRARVPHHLIDIVDPDETLSLVVFQGMARQIIERVHRSGKLPLLVGGTGQYIRAVTQGWKPPAVKPDPTYRAELARMSKDGQAGELHQRLTALDAEAAARIDPRNARRTIRALEVIQATGRKFSEQRGSGDSPYRLIQIGLARSRPELYARIDQRIEAMFGAGLLSEVERLLDQGYTAELPSMSAIGYRECVRVIRGEWSPEQAGQEMRRATRIYVRRQSNWFKQSDPEIRWFGAADPQVAAAIVSHIRSNLQDRPG